MDKKHWGEKEKLLTTNSSIFSHSVFKRLILQTHKNQGFFGKGLTPYQNLELSKLKALADNNIKVTETRKFFFKKLENIVGNGENVGYDYFFLFFRSVF